MNVITRFCAKKQVFADDKCPVQYKLPNYRYHHEYFQANSEVLNPVFPLMSAIY